MCSKRIAKHEANTYKRTVSRLNNAVRAWSTGERKVAWRASRAYVARHRPVILIAYRIDPIFQEMCVLLTTHRLLQQVYAKTRKGQDEIMRPKFGLNSRQRRILIFLDGVNTLAEMHGHFPMQEMEDIIFLLSGQHFIFLVDDGSKNFFAPWIQDRGALPLKVEALDCFDDTHDRTSPHHRTSRTPLLTRDARKILKAKEFMLETAAIHLGILRRDIIQKIESAQTSQSLASLAGQWTMALCASRSAARYAQLYLEQLKCILFEEPDDPLAARFP